MKKKIITISIICCSLFCFSCSQNSNNNTNTESNSDTIQKEESALKQLVLQWNNAHVSKDVGVFSQLFDNSVLFYGTRLDKNTCIEKKLSLFKKSPDFYQQIDGDISIEQSNDGEVTCSFIKRVTVNQETKDYPSYLTFRKIDGDWKIVVEGDLVTDKNLAKREEKTSDSNQRKSLLTGSAPV